MFVYGGVEPQHFFYFESIMVHCKSIVYVICSTVIFLLNDTLLTIIRISAHLPLGNAYFVIYLSTLILQFGIPAPTTIIGNESIHIFQFSFRYPIIGRHPCRRHDCLHYCLGKSKTVSM